MGPRMDHALAIGETAAALDAWAGMGAGSPAARRQDEHVGECAAEVHDASTEALSTRYYTEPVREILRRK